MLNVKQKLPDALAVALMLAITYALKLHYSRADAEALAWVLAPTASLVEALVRAPFIAERGVGYVNTDLRFAIATSCAGVNFMIVAICAATIGFVKHPRTLLGKFGLVLGCVPIAFGATVGVNALRIVLAIGLQSRPIGSGMLSGPQEHQAMGIVVYFSALCLLYLLAERALTKATSA